MSGPSPDADAALREARALLSQEYDGADAVPEPIRLLNHFACTGGTLIAKCVAAMPNCVIMSEIDPLSRMHLDLPQKPFFPTDFMADLRFSPRPIPDAVLIKVFNAALLALRDALAGESMHLVLRGHAHSQFCATPDPASRPTLQSLVAAIAPVHSVITVRHPMASFLALDNHGWKNFKPFTIAEYAHRYLMFLDAHEGLPVYRYEDFVDDPHGVLERLCADLSLTFNPDFASLIGAFQLSGDSGRSGLEIAPRAPRPAPDEIITDARESAKYATLCARLGYDPAWPRPDPR